MQKMYHISNCQFGHQHVRRHTRIRVEYAPGGWDRGFPQKNGRGGSFTILNKLGVAPGQVRVMRNFAIFFERRGGFASIAIWYMVIYIMSLRLSDLGLPPPQGNQGQGCAKFSPPSCQSSPEVQGGRSIHAPDPSRPFLKAGHHRSSG